MIVGLSYKLENRHHISAASDTRSQDEEMRKTGTMLCFDIGPWCTHHIVITIRWRYTVFELTY